MKPTKTSADGSAKRILHFGPTDVAGAVPKVLVAVGLVAGWSDGFGIAVTITADGDGLTSMAGAGGVDGDEQEITAQATTNSTNVTSNVVLWFMALPP